MSKAIDRLRALLEAPGCGKFLAESFYPDRPPMTCGDGVNMCGDCLELKRRSRIVVDATVPQLLAVVEAAQALRVQACSVRTDARNRLERGSRSRLQGAEDGYDNAHAALDAAISAHLPAEAEASDG